MKFSGPTELNIPSGLVFLAETRSDFANIRISSEGGELLAFFEHGPTAIGGKEGGWVTGGEGWDHYPDWIQPALIALTNLEQKHPEHGLKFAVLRALIQKHESETANKGS